VIVQKILTLLKDIKTTSRLMYSPVFKDFAKRIDEAIEQLESRRGLK